MRSIMFRGSVASAGMALAILTGCFESRVTVTAPEETPDRVGTLQALYLFETPAGTIVSEAYTTLGDGPILVNGVSPLIPGENTAMVFDTANPTGGDWDLGTPNETCGGPGRGEGGEVGSPYENCTPLHKVLVIAASLEDEDGDGLVDDPDDIDEAGLDGVQLHLDFSALGSVTMHEADVLDIDGNKPDPRVEMYGAGGALLSSVPMPSDMGDNGAARMDLGDVSGVVTVIVHLQGSGAIDTFFFTREEPSGECDPIDFETLPAGTILSEVYTAGGIGPILVSGENPELGSANAAIIFDTANPTGGDWDLGTPNETCGGPGRGAGGEAGSTYENCDALGNVLIVAADLVDEDGDGLVDDPDDIDHMAIDGAALSFDFSEVGTVTTSSITVLDFDGNAPDPRVELFGADGAVLATFAIPNDTGNNGKAVVGLGETSGVARMVVHVQGSAGIDDICIRIDDGGGPNSTRPTATSAG